MGRDTTKWKLRLALIAGGFVAWLTVSNGIARMVDAPATVSSPRGAGVAAPDDNDRGGPANEIDDFMQLG
jgi:hypothetical protein